MSLECDRLTFVDKMDIGSFTATKISSNWTEFYRSIWYLFMIHCNKIHTWIIGWMFEKAGGNSISYDTCPTICRNFNGLIYMGLSLPLLPNLIMPFMGDTRKNNRSLTLNLIAWILGQNNSYTFSDLPTSNFESPKLGHKENLYHKLNYKSLKLRK